MAQRSHGAWQTIVQAQRLDLDMEITVEHGHDQYCRASLEHNDLGGYFVPQRG